MNDRYLLKEFQIFNRCAWLFGL